MFGLTKRLTKFLIKAQNLYVFLSTVYSDYRTKTSSKVITDSEWNAYKVIKAKSLDRRGDAVSAL